MRGCCPNDHLNPFEVAETSRGQMLNRGDRAACVIRHTKERARTFERVRTVRIWIFIYIHIDPSHAVAMSLNGKQRDVTEIERSVWTEAMMKAGKERNVAEIEQSVWTEAMMKATNVPQNIRGKVVVEAVTMAVQLDGLTVVESDGKSAMRD